MCLLCVRYHVVLLPGERAFVLFGIWLHFTVILIRNISARHSGGTTWPWNNSKLSFLYYFKLIQQYPARMPPSPLPEAYTTSISGTLADTAVYRHSTEPILFQIEQTPLISKGFSILTQTYRHLHASLGVHCCTLKQSEA